MSGIGNIGSNLLDLMCCRSSESSNEDAEFEMGSQHGNGAGRGAEASVPPPDHGQAGTTGGNAPTPGDDGGQAEPESSFDPERLSPPAAPPLPTKAQLLAAVKAGTETPSPASVSDRPTPEPASGLAKTALRFDASNAPSAGSAQKLDEVRRFLEEADERHPPFREYLSVATEKGAKPITVEGSSDLPPRGGLWNPEKRKILIETEHGTADHMKGVGLFEVLNSANSKAFEAIQKEAENGSLERQARDLSVGNNQVVGRGDGKVKGRDLYANNIELVEFYSIQNHNDLVAGLRSAGVNVAAETGMYEYRSSGVDHRNYSQSTAVQDAAGHTRRYRKEYKTILTGNPPSGLAGPAEEHQLQDAMNRMRSGETFGAATRRAGVVQPDGTINEGDYRRLLDAKREALQERFRQALGSEGESAES